MTNAKTKDFIYYFNHSGWAIVRGTWQNAGLYLEHNCSKRHSKTYRYARPVIAYSNLNTPCDECGSKASSGVITVYRMLL